MTENFLTKLKKESRTTMEMKMKNLKFNAEWQKNSMELFDPLSWGVRRKTLIWDFRQRPNTLCMCQWQSCNSRCTETTWNTEVCMGVVKDMKAMAKWPHEKFAITLTSFPKLNLKSLTNTENIWWKTAVKWSFWTSCSKSWSRNKKGKFSSFLSLKSSWTSSKTTAPWEITIIWDSMVIPTCRKEKRWWKCSMKTKTIKFPSSCSQPGLVVSVSILSPPALSSSTISTGTLKMTHKRWTEPTELGKPNLLTSTKWSPNTQLNKECLKSKSTNSSGMNLSSKKGPSWTSKTMTSSQVSTMKKLPTWKKDKSSKSKPEKTTIRSIK